MKDSTNVTGAPLGTSSKSSLNLKDSYLELSNLDLQNEIQNNDNGSFTISKWVNLSSLNESKKSLIYIGNDVSLKISNNKLELSLDEGITSSGAQYGTSYNNALTAENSGISADNTYTHAISGGAAESVNGVDFELLNVSTTPTNFAWDVSSIKNQLNDNNGGWNAGASGVTDVGLQGLLGSFTFNNDGTVGSNQTFTLSGLTAGQDYKFTLFSRKWDNSHTSSRSLTSLRMVKLHQSRLARIILSLR